jgi:hypothetical protein
MTPKAIVPRDPKKTNAKRLLIRLEPLEMQKVEKFAVDDGRSLSSFMRRMCMDGLELHERKQATKQ